LQQTSAATTVRVTDGKTRVLDGPHADSKEQLGGLHIIEVADLDAAIAWAARSPTALHGVVEVRPLMEGMLLTRDIRGSSSRNEGEAMRRVIAFEQVSLDGFFVDTNGDMSWAHKQDPELFEGVKEKIPLKLVKSRAFGNGNVVLYYEPMA
jgi:hypothetical protein